MSNVLNSNYIEKSCQIYPLHFAQILSPAQLMKPNLNINSRNLTINLKNCPNLISKIYFRFIPFPYFMSPFCFKFGLSFKLILCGLNPNPSFFISIPTIHSKKNLKKPFFPSSAAHLVLLFFSTFLVFFSLISFLFLSFPSNPTPSFLSLSFLPTMLLVKPASSSANHWHQSPATTHPHPPSLIIHLSFFPPSRPFSSHIFSFFPSPPYHSLYLFLFFPLLHHYPLRPTTS